MSTISSQWNSNHTVYDPKLGKRKTVYTAGKARFALERHCAAVHGGGRPNPDCPACIEILKKLEDCA